jgi:hypothetical protein
MPNNRIKFARFACPTRKGDAPSLAAYARRWAMTMLRVGPVITLALLCGCNKPASEFVVGQFVFTSPVAFRRALLESA